MELIIQSIERSLSAKAWHCSLMAALALPDICARIDNGASKTSGKLLYATWFEEYIGPRYKSLSPKIDLNAPVEQRVKFPLEMEENVFLSGKDCYSLRCAVLHEASDDTGKNKPEKITKFQFVGSESGAVIHCNRAQSMLQLDVHIFCTDIIAGVRKWLKSIEGSKEKTDEVDSLFTITIV
ncbi:hypothetical protein FHW83_003708 [Duganella sp. SG902]|uniref:hypothetical protein n=1 Tax=Duganella sp. SG902 TaxID=2587016 RepID=UPI00159D5D46|nr:hypothetical protein [Duganella sp. SG902]NVM77885.1 hypothetical protein [Duganella sp. SG902]